MSREICSIYSATATPYPTLTPYPTQTPYSTATSYPPATLYPTAPTASSNVLYADSDWSGGLGGGRLRLGNQWPLSDRQWGHAVL